MSSGELQFWLSQYSPVRQKVTIILEQAMKVYWGVEVQLHAFFNLGARWGMW